MSDIKKPQFTSELRVGFRDRGLGRGDYGVITGDQVLVARVEDWDSASSTPLPALENGLLFAAAPALYEACLEALQWFQDHGAADCEQAVRLRQALEQAVTVPGE